MATDHAGFVLRNEIVTYLETLPVQVVLCGAHQLDPQDDFTDFIPPAIAHMTAHGTRAGAIIFGGSGQGEAMAANRHAGVRATVYYGGALSIVSLGRQHNNANVLSLGARFLTVADAIQAIDVWLHTPPLPDEKYARRNAALDHLYE
jgi:ribose 5-phosphate isomerase B